MLMQNVNTINLVQLRYRKRSKMQGFWDYTYIFGWFNRTTTRFI